MGFDAPRGLFYESAPKNRRCPEIGIVQDKDLQLVSYGFGDDDDGDDDDDD